MKNLIDQNGVRILNYASPSSWDDLPGFENLHIHPGDENTLFLQCGALIRFQRRDFENGDVSAVKGQFNKAAEMFAVFLNQKFEEFEKTMRGSK